jgi:hypothetical protein
MNKNTKKKKKKERKPGAVTAYCGIWKELEIALRETEWVWRVGRGGCPFILVLVHGQGGEAGEWRVFD